MGSNVIGEIKKFAKEHKFVVVLSREPERGHKKDLERFYKNIVIAGPITRKCDPLAVGRPNRIVVHLDVVGNRNGAATAGRAYPDVSSVAECQALSIRAEGKGTSTVKSLWMRRLKLGSTDRGEHRRG